MAGHAQVNDQRAVRETDQQVFAAPSGQTDRAAAQQRGQIGRKRPAQAGTAHYHAGYDLPLQIGRNAAASDFNFRQFRHDDPNANKHAQYTSCGDNAQPENKRLSVKSTLALYHCQDYHLKNAIVIASLSLMLAACST
jgi:hypothetical protein